MSDERKLTDEAGYVPLPRAISTPVIAMVAVAGPDPKVLPRAIVVCGIPSLSCAVFQAVKHQGRVFFHHAHGMLTLSASATLVADTPSRLLFVTSATLIAPFLKQPVAAATGQTQDGYPSVVARPELVVDTTVRLRIPVTAHDARTRPQRSEWVAGRAMSLFTCTAVRDAAFAVMGSAALIRRRGVAYGDMLLIEVLKRDMDASRPTDGAAGGAASDGGVVGAVRLAVSSAANDSLSPPVARGQPVTIVCSPFGLVCPPVFSNSVTCGVVSNIAAARAYSGMAARHTSSLVGSSRHVFAATSDRPALFFTDARGLPGSEGGGVLCSRRGHLVGIVAPDMPGGDSLNALTPVFALNVVLEGVEAALAALFPKQGIDRSGHAGAGIGTSTASASGTRIGARERFALDTIPTLQHAYRCLVFIDAGGCWGSGILVSPRGHVVTCAHLFDKALGASFSAAGRGSRTAGAFITYRQPRIAHVLTVPCAMLQMHGRLCSARRVTHSAACRCVSDLMSRSAVARIPASTTASGNGTTRRCCIVHGANLTSLFSS